MRASINDIWNEEIRISENSEIKTPDHVNKMTPILAKPQLGKAVGMGNAAKRPK